MSKPISAIRRPLALILLLTIFGFRFQTFDNLPRDHLTNHISSNRKVSLTGIIVLPPEKFTRKTRLYLESETLTTNGKTIKVSSKIRVTVYENNLPFKYGDRIKINAVRLRVPRNFKNEGAFDYESYMKNRGIYFTGSVSKGKKIELIDRNNGFWLLEKIYYFKDSMLTSLESFLSQENSNIVKAMVLGDRGALSKSDREAFIRSGTAHLMAVSGLHIGFVAFVSYWIIRKITALFMVRFFIEKALSGWMIPISAILSRRSLVNFFIDKLSPL
ncbi:MAG: ComEC/Rec2 family competence protein [Nitrospinota bacterium]